MEFEREKKKTEESMRDPFTDQSFYDEIVSFVKNEYERRKREKAFLEVQWQLNYDFLEGRQYSIADYKDFTTVELDRLEEGQERSVHNEIAPIIETRRAKQRQLNTFMSVISSTAENDDIKNAEITTQVLQNTYNKLSFDEKLERAIGISETIGTFLFKNTWDNNGGEIAGADSKGNVEHEGEILCDVISPYEIFPDDLSRQSLEEQISIIHAKILTRDELFLKYGIEIAGSSNSVYRVGTVAHTTGNYDYATNQTISLSKDELSDSAVLIEYYERPSRFYPEGRLIVVCEDVLIDYKKELPYRNAANKNREFPFVKVDCISRMNSFFGLSVIERLIPIQQEYNAVHNRINEYLRRTTIGIPLVEEDSLVDEEELDEVGFMPGVPVRYERGSTPPRFMETPSLPAAFLNKLQELKQDLIVVSGISEISRNSNTPGALTSGVGIQLLQQQDDTRMSLTGKNILQGLKRCGQQWLYLYKQFATTSRVVRYTGMAYPVCRKWTNSNLNSFDIIVADDSNMYSNTALTRELASTLFAQGFFNGGRFERLSYLSLLRNGDINKAYQEEFLDIKNAEKENYLFQEENKIPKVRSEDDHELHFKQHNILRKSDWYRDVLIASDNSLAKEFDAHCEEHKKYLAVPAESEKGQNNGKI